MELNDEGKNQTTGRESTIFTQSEQQTCTGNINENTRNSAMMKRYMILSLKYSSEAEAVFHEITTKISELYKTHQAID